MKYLFVIFLALSCSTKKPDTASTATPPGNPGESEAKQVSPYTVQPCYCMKIFQPVCAGGKNYGNSCEAECHGHKTWKEGSCPKK